MKKYFFILVLFLLCCSLSVSAQTGQPVSSQKGAVVSPGQSAQVSSDSLGARSNAERGQPLPAQTQAVPAGSGNGTAQPAEDKKKPNR